MLDAPVRRLLAPALDAIARPLAAAHVAPLALTAAGWLAGLGACVAVAVHAYLLALALWLLNRTLDGLDGALARRRGATELGGFLDIVADFSIYAGFVVGVGVGHPGARVACLVLLGAYYVSGTAFLALSSLAERLGTAAGDERSLRFVGGLAEGTETVLAYVVFCLLPDASETIAWIFAAVVAITAGQRIVVGVRMLHRAARLTHPRER